MDNEENVKVDTTSQAAVTEKAQVVGTIVEKSTDGGRPTSYVTSKNALEPLRPTKGLLSENSIHGIHIVIFIGLLFVLFYGMWAHGKKTKF